MTDRTASAEIVSAKKGISFSWTWVFPILAIAATALLFWNNWRSQGPEIEVRFKEAPGLEPGKTHLIYRGVRAGEVSAVRLDSDLDRVIVSIRLRAFAADLAREGTLFWVEKPVVSLHGVDGLEALIQGNSIEALVTMSDGAPQSRFDALDEPPLSKINAPSLSIVLEAHSIPFINRGTPVFHRGTRVGWVENKQLDGENDATAHITIEEQYADTVRENTRFWLVQAASLSASPGQIQLNLPSISAILDGGVAYDNFEKPEAPVRNGATFSLCVNEIAARANGPLLTIEFDSAIAMRPGETRVAYLGQPVGIVESIAPIPEQGKALATIRVARALTPLINSSAEFHFVRPSITWRGITGLESLVAGPYIEFHPGHEGEPATHFVAVSPDAAHDKALATEYRAQQVILESDEIPTLSPGTPVYYRGVAVGAVLSKEPSPGGGVELRIGLRESADGLIRTDSRFWRVPATEIAAGPGVIEARIEGLAALLFGGIAFDHPGEGTPAAEQTRFRLFSSRTLAEAVSPPVRIAFSDGQGLLAGRTQLRYLGLPVGIVEDIRITPKQVEVTARFLEGYDFLRRADSTFKIVRPELSLEGIQGVETLVSGIYITCQPGNSPRYATDFQGLESEEDQIETAPGFEVRLTSSATQVAPGAPVLYNDMPIGEITRKTLSSDGKQVVLSAKILEDYRELIRDNSVFWDDSAVQAKVGFFKFQIDAPTIVAPQGKVAFFTPEGGAPVKREADFPLHPKKPRLPR